MLKDFILPASNGGGSAGTFGTLIIMVAFLFFMYIFLIRPQRKQEKKTQAMRDALKVGDEIITIGGITGKIVRVKGDNIVVAVGSDKVKIELKRWSVGEVVDQSGGSDKGSAGSAKEEKSEEEEEKQGNGIRRLGKKAKKDSEENTDGSGQDKKAEAGKDAAEPDEAPSKDADGPSDNAGEEVSDAVPEKDGSTEE